MPQVSIIMNCFNSARYLKEALDSVYRQTFKDYEIIFWDNQSTDGSDKIAQSYGNPLKYFRGDEFLPLGNARNAAIAKAQGKYIAFLDCDDIWLSDKLEKQIALFNTKKNLGLVYSDCYIIDEAGVRTPMSYFYSFKPLRGMVFHELFQKNPIPLLTAVITREAVEKVGIFNPRYEICEEYDLWLRIARQYPIDFISVPLGKYRVHSQSATSRHRILDYKEELQIRASWVNMYPEIKKQFGGRLKALKFWPTLLAALGQVYHDKSWKTLRELKIFPEIFFATL
jgi:glycosyltransferase involved in cell wall biosynthesis